jgi:hypothetical protein
MWRKGCGDCRRRLGIPPERYQSPGVTKGFPIIPIYRTDSVDITGAFSEIDNIERKRKKKVKKRRGRTVPYLLINKLMKMSGRSRSGYKFADARTPNEKTKPWLL